jgi:hypothetical protein
MHLIRSMQEMGGAINRSKESASAFCTNLFPAPQKLEGWICHGELLYEQGEGVALFVRKDRDFGHLYFCAASPAALQRALETFPMIKTHPLVADLIGPEAALEELVELLESAGFRVYKRLFRMARTIAPASPAAVGRDPRIMIAGRSDCQSILNLMLQSFDCRAEQIPMLYEIEEAVEARRILIVQCGGALAGLLFFETQGLTSTLRYWLIAPEFRDQHFGSGLMHWYFTEHPSVRRFLLWVLADNAGAIRKYEHYGFRPDGLVDHVLANEVISP